MGWKWGGRQISGSSRGLSMAALDRVSNVQAEGILLSSPAEAGFPSQMPAQPRPAQQMGTGICWACAQAGRYC